MNNFEYHRIEMKETQNRIEEIQLKTPFKWSTIFLLIDSTIVTAFETPC